MFCQLIPLMLTSPDSSILTTIFTWSNLTWQFESFVPDCFTTEITKKQMCSGYAALCQFTVNTCYAVLGCDKSITMMITSCCSTGSERPHRCCHLPNNVGSRRIYPVHSFVLFTFMLLLLCFCVATVSRWIKVYNKLSPRRAARRYAPRQWQFDSRRIYVRPRTGPQSVHG